MLHIQILVKLQNVRRIYYNTQNEDKALIQVNYWKKIVGAKRFWTPEEKSEKLFTSRKLGGGKGPHSTPYFMV
jgi:hypothetical protein